MSFPQSTSYTMTMKLFLAGTNTPATGKTAAVTISKAGGAFGNPSAGSVNATEISGGVYSYSLSTTDANTLGDLWVQFTATGCDVGDRCLPIVKATNGGMTAIPDTAVSTNASLLTSGTGTDQLSVLTGLVSLNMGQALPSTLTANTLGGLFFLMYAQSASRIFQAAGGGTNTITLDAGASAANGSYIGDLVFIYGSTGAGQLPLTIISHNVGTGVLTVNRTWATQPDSTSLCFIVPKSKADIALANATPVSTTVSGKLDVNAQYVGGTLQTGRDLGASVLLSSGSGTGQLLLTSGKVNEVIVTDAVSSPVQVNNIGESSAALNAVATAFTQTTGSVTSGTFANTATLDGVSHVTADSAGTLDEYYDFSIGTTGQIGTSFQFEGYLVGVANTLKVFAFNWTSSAWDQIGNIPGLTTTTDMQYEFDLINSHTSNTGIVRVRFNNTGLTSSSLNADRLLVGFTTVYSFPSNFAVMNVDSSGRLLLQPTQTGVTIPTVTNVASGVTVTTNNDKTGYTLTQTFPANFSALGIGSTGHITTVDTAVNLTNSPTVGSLTAAMVAQVTAAVPNVAAIQSGLATASALSTVGSVAAATQTIVSSGTYGNAALLVAIDNSGGGSAPTVAQIAAGILKTPSNLLATNSDGSVNVTGDIVVQNNVTINPAQANAALQPTAIAIVRGDVLSVALPLFGTITARTKLVVTCKTAIQTLSLTNTDSMSLFQISESGGLIVFNGASTGFPSTDGSLTVTDATTGAVTLRLNAAETAQFPLEDLVLDAQWWDSLGPHTPVFCTASVSADVTQSTI